MLPMAYILQSSAALTLKITNFLYGSQYFSLSILSSTSVVFVRNEKRLNQQKIFPTATFHRSALTCAHHVLFPKQGSGFPHVPHEANRQRTNFKTE